MDFCNYMDVLANESVYKGGARAFASKGHHISLVERSGLYLRSFRCFTISVLYCSVL